MPRQHVQGSARADAPPAVLRPATARKCAECGATLATGSIFCTPTHRTAFQRRIAKRGFKLAAPSIVDRVTRSGTRGDAATGKAASIRYQQLVQQFTDEDKAAGRMSMVDYYARRLALGYVD